MKKIFNKKLLFVLALFLFFILINCNSVHASDALVVSETYNMSFIDNHIDAGQSPFDAFKKIVDRFNDYSPGTLNFTSSDLPEYAVMFNVYNSVDKEDEYYFLFSTKKLCWNGGGSPDIYGQTSASILHFDNSDVPLLYYCSRVTKHGLVFIYNSIIEGSSSIFQFDGMPDYGGGSRFTINRITYDFKSAQTGDLVFQQPMLREATTLAPVIQAEKTKGTLQAVLQVIIRILPQIILVLVSLVGLRKALKMLSTLLRRS